METKPKSGNNLVLFSPISYFELQITQLQKNPKPFLNRKYNGQNRKFGSKIFHNRARPIETQISTCKHCYVWYKGRKLLAKSKWAIYWKRDNI